MAFSAFDDDNHQPDEVDLSRVLGPSYRSWTQLIAGVADHIVGLTLAWGFSSKKAGWTLRLRHKTRNLLYLTPQANRFVVSLALGEKAVAAARCADLPPDVLRAIDDAPRYAEGRGVRIEVTTDGLVAPLTVLAQVKHRN